MSERTFKYNEASLANLTTLVENMSANVEDLISTARKKTEGRIEGWSKESVSRRAQMAFDRRLEKRTDELTQALDEAANALSDIKDLAHNTEVRNVAVMD
jgi:putative methyl-accepting chemotaxis protein